MRPFFGFIALATLLFTLCANRADADLITLSANFVASGFRIGAPVIRLRAHTPSPSTTAFWWTGRG